MLSPQVQRAVRRLELVTKKLMDGPLAGDDVSAHRGYGVELDQLREYQFGDDVRFIDFKSSCRLGKMMIKECIEERNRRVIVAVDVSASSFYGSSMCRFEKIKEVAAILALAAHYARDSIGLVLFSNDIERVIEPKNGKHQVYRLINCLYEYQPTGAVTNMARLLQYCVQHWYKDALVLIVSDFIADDFDRALRAAVDRADVVAVRCYDSVERVMPAAGYVLTEDVEYASTAWIYAHGTYGAVAKELSERLKQQNRLFSQAGIDVLDVSYEQDACSLLIDFFKRRMVHATVRYG